MSCYVHDDQECSPNAKGGHGQTLKETKHNFSLNVNIALILSYLELGQCYLHKQWVKI
jgi:hypothetical protein